MAFLVAVRVAECVAVCVAMCVANVCFANVMRCDKLYRLCGNQERAVMASRKSRDACESRHELKKPQIQDLHETSSTSEM